MTDKVKRKLGYLPCYVGDRIQPFEPLFPGGSVNILDKGFDGVSAIVLWGGEDIHPSYYGAKAHHSNDKFGSKPSFRDINEWKAMIYAKANNIPIIGVCRGAQFLCAFVGGRLIQDCSNHNNGQHDVLCKTPDGEVYHKVTSHHHQMMYPFDVQHEMLAWCDKPLSTRYEVGPDGPLIGISGMQGKVEPEVVYFPQVNGFAIQGHPEWMSGGSPFVEWCLENISKYCFQEKFVPEEAVF